MTDRITLDFSQVEKFLAALDKFPEQVGRRNQATMSKVVAVVKGKIVENTPVNFGTLRQSFYSQVTGAPVNLTGRVATDLIYGLPVENGRPPGKMPPVEAIEIWVRRKLGISGDEAGAVAFLIARAIGARGTTGAKMAEKGLAQATPYVNQLWLAMLNEIVADFDRIPVK